MGCPVRDSLTKKPLKVFAVIGPFFVEFASGVDLIRVPSA
jgi:hypothetical protein